MGWEYRLLCAPGNITLVPWVAVTHGPELKVNNEPLKIMGMENGLSVCIRAHKKSNKQRYYLLSRTSLLACAGTGQTGNPALASHPSSRQP